MVHVRKKYSNPTSVVTGVIHTHTLYFFTGIKYFSDAIKLEIVILILTHNTVNYMFVVTVSLTGQIKSVNSECSL